MDKGNLDDVLNIRTFCTGTTTSTVVGALYKVFHYLLFRHFKVGLAFCVPLCGIT